MLYNWSYVSLVVGQIAVRLDPKLEKIGSENFVNVIYKNALPKALTETLLSVLMTKQSTLKHLSILEEEIKILKIAYFELNSFGHVGGESIAKMINELGLDEALKELEI
jgi:hypothetical protein